jgi:hypothetical protein
VVLPLLVKCYVSYIAGLLGDVMILPLPIQMKHEFTVAASAIAAQEDQEFSTLASTEPFSTGPEGAVHWKRQAAYEPHVRVKGFAVK